MARGRVANRNRKSAITAISIIGAIIAVLIVICAVLGFTGVISTPSFFGGDKDDESQSASAELFKETVPTDVQDMMNKGTPLVFGNKDAKPVTVITDPSGISRKSVLVGGDDSELIKAAATGKIRLNLYLRPSSEDRRAGTNAMLNAATCMIESDASKSKYLTLQSIAQTANNFTGQEGYDEMSKKMGLSKEVICPSNINSVVAQSEKNANYFTQNIYSVNVPTLIAANGGISQVGTSLPDGWMDKVKSNTDVREVIQ